MSSTFTTRLDEPDEGPQDPSAGVSRSGPGGRAKRRAGAARRSDPQPELADRVKELLPDHVIDELLAGAQTEQEITGQGGHLGQLTKRMVERAMQVELTDHLGYAPHAEPPGGIGNARNGSTPKRLLTESGEVQSTRRVIATAALSLRSSQSASGALKGSMTRSWRSMRAR